MALHARLQRRRAAPHRQAGLLAGQSLGHNLNGPFLVRCVAQGVVQQIDQYAVQVIGGKAHAGIARGQREPQLAADGVLVYLAGADVGDFVIQRDGVLLRVGRAALVLHAGGVQHIVHEIPSPIKANKTIIMNWT